MGAGHRAQGVDKLMHLDRRFTKAAPVLLHAGQ